MGSNREMEDLSGEELVAMAMLAFLHMHETKKMPDDQLLEDILTWFRVMTMETDFMVTDVEPARVQ